MDKRRSTQVQGWLSKPRHNPPDRIRSRRGLEWTAELKDNLVITARCLARG